MRVILCHKCAGVLSVAEGKGDTGLYGCQCISGWVRGFEPTLSIEEAARKQVKRELEWLALYTSQGRPDVWSPARLIVAIKKCPEFGYGTVDWEALAKEGP